MRMLRRREGPTLLPGRRRRLPHVLGFLGGLACLLASLAGVQAQDDDGAESFGAIQFPEADRRPLQDLRNARRAIDDERFDEAVSLLGRLLTTDPSKAGEEEAVLREDYFIKDQGVRTSIKSEAMRLLDRIPAKAMRQYELQYGAEAEALLDEAFTKGDAEKLAEVMRRFFHTEAGYRASLALGRLHLEQGRPLSAAAYLKRVVETPAAHRIVEPEASVLLAGALLHAGQNDKAKETLLALKQRQPTFAIRGAKSPAFATDEEALPWLEKLFGRPQAGDAPTTLQWTMFRGTAERNAVASFAEPASTPRWKVPILNDPNDEQLVADIARSFQQQGIPSLPSIHVLAVQNVVLMRGPERLTAVEATSGKRIWEYPWQVSGAEQELRRLQTASNGAATRANQLKQRVWDDAPVGQLSSDGELVYFVDDLGDALWYGGAPTNIIDPFNRVRRNPYAPKPSNKLYALSLQKQGKLMWEIPRGKDDPLHEAFFLGAPLPVNGQVFVIAEIKGEIALLSLDGQKGDLKWKQQLAHVENSNVLTDSLRRLAGASPSYADGILVCPTTAGAVIAVDVASRRLLWGVPYGRDRGSRPDSGYNLRNVTRYGDRWVDGTATIADSRVILTPPDSSDLLCLDLQTGKPAWPAQKRDDLLFVAGVHQGTIVAVGKQRVVGIKLADGSRAWADIQIDTPSGRGLLDKNHYYQPASTGKMHVIDVAAGEIKQSFATAKPLGNLVSYKDDILSLSDACLAAYPRVDRLEQKINEALAKNAKDPWALARRGELLMHERKWEEALGVLRESFAQPKPDPAVQGLLVETMLSLLEADFVKHISLTTEVEKLIDEPAAGNRYHRVVALGREKSGDRVGAFRAFLAIDDVGQAASLPETGDAQAGSLRYVDLDQNHRAKSDRWIAAHLASLYEESSGEQRPEMDRAIDARLKEIPRNAPAALRRFVERFAFHPQALEAQLSLAEVLVESNNLLEAESLVRELRDVSDRSIAGRSIVLSAKILARAGRWQEAAARYEQVGKEFADVEVAAGVTGRQLRDDAAKQFDYRQALASLGRSFPRGRAVIEADARSTVRNVPDRKTHPLALLQADSIDKSPPTIVLEPLQNMLRVRDSRGHDTTVVNLTRADNRRFYSNVTGLYTARIAGNLLIVSTGHEVIAIDLLRGGRDPSEIVLWRHDAVDTSDRGEFTIVQTRGLHNPWAAPRFIPADTNNRPIGVVSPITSSGLCFIKQRTLMCVDPLTGETLWQRSDADAGSDLLGDEELLFVSPHNSEEAQVYRMLDGTPLGKRKLANFEHRWATSGRRVLSWSQDGKGMQLRLDDVWSEKNVWTENAVSGSKAWMCSPEEIAIITPDGKFKIRSLRSEAVKVEAQLEKEPNLQQLYVLKSRDQYFAFVAVSPSNNLPNTIVQPAPGGNHSPLFTGKVYAFDAASGQSSWPAPAVVSLLGLPLDQPLDQPVLLFLGNLNPRTGADRQKVLTSMLCLDKRSGAVLFQDDKIPNSTATYDLAAEADAAAVRVAVPGKSIRIRFTEDPAPPEPPAQNDYAVVAARASGGVWGATKRALPSPLELFGDP